VQLCSVGLFRLTLHLDYQRDMKWETEYLSHTYAKTADTRDLSMPVIGKSISGNILTYWQLTDTFQREEELMRKTIILTMLILTITATANAAMIGILLDNGLRQIHNTQYILRINAFPSGNSEIISIAYDKSDFTKIRCAYKNDRPNPIVSKILNALMSENSIFINARGECKRVD